MPAHIEPFAGVIRYWESADAKHGDPYQWVASVRWIDNETIEIVGVTQAPTPTIWKAVKAAAKEYGAKQVVFVRYKDGTVRTRKIPL